MAENFKPNTARTYERAWVHFTTWCEVNHLDHLSDVPGTIVAYLEYLVKEEHRPISTVRTYAAAIAALRRNEGISSVSDHPDVKAALRRLAKEHAPSKKHSAGLTGEDLDAITRMVEAYGESSSREARRARVDLALILVMRNGLLRVSDAAALRWGDVAVLADGGALIRLSRSKTGREGNGALVYVGQQAVRALSATQPHKGIKAPEEKVFGLSAGQINRRVKAAAAAAGLDKEYSGDSMRLGMVQDINARLHGLNIRDRLLSTFFFSGHWNETGTPRTWRALPDDMSDEDFELLSEYLAAHNEIDPDNDRADLDSWALGPFVDENGWLNPQPPILDGDLRYRSVLARAKMWKERYDAGRQAGYDDGYHKGLDDGHRQGYANGRYLGENDGYSKGLEAGRNAVYYENYRQVYDQGLQAGRRAGYQKGYTQARKEGLDEGRYEILSEAFEDGHCQGLELGLKKGLETGFEKALLNDSLQQAVPTELNEDFEDLMESYRLTNRDISDS